MKKVLCPIRRSDESESFVSLSLDRAGCRRHTRLPLLFVCVRDSADEYHTFRCRDPAHQGGNQAVQTARLSQVGLDCRTLVLLRRALFGARKLSQGWGHVDRSRTRVLLGDVRGEAVRRDLLAAEPAEGLAGRDVDALHCITSMGDCRLDVKRESAWRQKAGSTASTCSSLALFPMRRRSLFDERRAAVLNSRPLLR